MRKPAFATAVLDHATAVLDHATAFDLVPWLANGTLEGAELEALLEHLKTCPECRDELRFLPELRWALTETEPPPPPEPALARLLARIDAQEGVRERPLPSRRVRSPGGVPWWRPALAMQAVAILVLGVALFWPRPEPALFRTLATPALDAPAGVRVRLVLADSTPLAEIRALLGEVGGQIVGGPSAVGALSIEIAPELAITEALARLRAASAVRLAEPLTGATAGESRE